MDPSKALKTAVLKDEMGYLCEELGDPGRYIPSLRSKNLLDTRDTELIRNQPTSSQKVEALVDIIIKRQGHSSEHPLDILINELKKQRVQVHIARRLQRTLKKRLKDADTEPSTTSTGGASAYEQQQSKTSYERHQSHPDMSDFMDGPTLHTNQEPSSYQGPSYEISPSVGPIPGQPPALTTSYITETSSASSFDVEHGALPGTPPPTSHQQFTDPPPQQHFAGGSGQFAGGPGTPPRGSQPTLAEGMQYMTLNEPIQNGEYEAGGQSTRGYSSLDTNSSMPSGSYSNYTTVTEASDLEKEKLRAQVQQLAMLLEQEQNQNRTLREQLMAAKQEMTHSRQELASIKQEYAKLSAEVNATRQDPVVRPGTLFPAYPEQQQVRGYYRQLSPARADSGGRHSMGSQGDNLSIQSANSSTSVNSNSSSQANTPRTQMQQSYV